MENSWLSILPPLLAIGLAISSKQVFISLFSGILLGWIIGSEWNILKGLSASMQGLVDVFKESGNTEVILFCGLVGALIALTQRNGGFHGFVELAARKDFLNRRRGAQFAAATIGLLIFVETSISSLITGAVSRPVFDRLKISREKLAYICDSTSAPVNLLIPLNAWGAYVIGLLSQEDVNNPLAIMVASIPYNLYAIGALLLVFLTIYLQRDFGPMKVAEKRARTEGKLIREGAQPVMSEELINTPPKAGIQTQAMDMLIPVLVMIIMMPVGLFITGRGDLTAGSGSTAVLWAVSFSTTAPSTVG